MDAGVTLVELVVAVVVLGLIGAAVTGVLIQSLDLSRDNAQRVQAASVARTQLEALRSRDVLNVPDGASSLGPTTVQGTEYSSALSTSFLPASASTACTGVSGSATQDLPYRRLTVTVTWPGMGTAAPVRADTLLAVSAAERVADQSRGSVAVAVTDFDGSTPRPLAGALVTLGGQSQTTGEDGCVLFRALAPGSSTATVSAPGYVDVNGASSTARSVTITAGRLYQVPAVELARPGRLDVSLTVPTGHTPLLAVADLPVTLDSARFPSPTYRVFATCSAGAAEGCVSGYPRSAAALFPSTYTVSAGQCSTATGTGGAPTAAVQPGTTTSPTVPLAGFTVQLASGSSATLTAVSSARSGCTGLAVPATTVANGARLALPRGQWTFARSGSATSVMVTLDGSVASPVVTL